MKLEVRCKQDNSVMKEKILSDWLRIYVCLACGKRHKSDWIYIIKV